MGPCLQARLSLMLELLGERNERIEQLDMDVQVPAFLLYRALGRQD